MESPALERAKVLEEDGNEGCDILGSFFSCALRGVRSSRYITRTLSRGCTYDGFTMISVGESNADRLVDEEDVGLFVPRVRIEFGSVGLGHSAGT